MCGRSSNLSAGQTAAAAASVLRSGRLSLAMKSDGRAELGMAPRPVWKSQGKHEQRDVRPGDYLSVLRLERASAILHSMHCEAAPSLHGQDGRSWTDGAGRCTPRGHRRRLRLADV